jgi:hypothetical protein
MSIEDYRTSFPQDLDEHLYHYCLTDALKYFTQVAKFNIPPGVSQFTFHRRVESEHNAREVYSYFSGIPEWQAFMGRDLTFDDDASVRIQAADLVARESMKHLDNAIGQSRPRRRSWIALKRSGRFVFMEYRRDSFERMKARAAELHGPNIPEYCQWIADRKLGDNMSNRIHFMNAQDPAGKFGTRWG